MSTSALNLIDDDDDDGLAESTNRNTNESFKRIIPQSYVTFVECFFMTFVGRTVILLGEIHWHVRGRDSYLWIAYITVLIVPFAEFTAGFLTEKFGRKRVLMLINIPFFIAWFFCYFAKASALGLVIVTCILGYGAGLAMAVARLYVSETCEPNLRGVLNSVVISSYTISHTIHTYAWQIPILVCAAISVVSFLLFLTIPESPVWLITKGRMEEAQKALGWLRGFVEPQQVQKEFDDLVRYCDCSSTFSSVQPYQDIETNGSQDRKRVVNSAATTIKIWIEERYMEVVNPKLYLPLRLVFILSFLTQYTAIGYLKHYSYIVGKVVAFSKPDSLQVITGVTSCLGYLAVICVIKFTGRRVLYLSCMAMAAISITVTALYISFSGCKAFYSPKDVCPRTPMGFLVGWLLITGYPFVNAGISNILWMLSSEVFPVRVRSMAVSICAGSLFITGHFFMRIYPTLDSLIGLGGIFYLYAAMSLAGCIYIYLYVPETEGKSLEHIETYFTPQHDPEEKFKLPPKDDSGRLAGNDQPGLLSQIASYISSIRLPLR